MRGRLVWRHLAIVLSLAVAGFPAQRVAANDPPPPPVLTSPLESPAMFTPAGPCVLPCLYDQMDSADPNNVVLSQDSTTNGYDSQAADDFSVPGDTASWHITAIEVAGHYGSGGADTPSLNSVNVLFYADSAGLPGYQLPPAASASIAVTASSGIRNNNFYIPLNHAVDLASNGTYWVSVQAVQSTSWYWYWRERTVLFQSPAVWQNPTKGFLTGCTSWTPVNHCFAGTGPDLLFRLYGSQSTNHVAPILLSLNPNSAINRTFTLNASGIGFANGAKVDWTLGTTQHISTTVSSSGQLSAIVPAADVASFGAIVSVTVTNPGPCSGSCTSNALTFRVSNFTYLPLVRR